MPNLEVIREKGPGIVYPSFTIALGIMFMSYCSEGSIGETAGFTFLMIGALGLSQETNKQAKPKIEHSQI